MKKYLLFIAICSMALILSSCKGEQNTPMAPVEYGTIQCVNNSKYPFTVTIKGNTPLTFSIQGRSSITKKVEVGYYNIHVKQQSGYLLYATENDYDGYVQKDRNLIVSFTD